MKTLTQTDKDAIQARVDKITRQKRSAERAKSFPPEPDDKFHDQIEQYALDNKCSFQKALAPMATQFPAEFGAYRRRVRDALMPDADKKELAAKLARNLFGTVEFSELKKLEAFIQEIRDGEQCDLPQALKIMLRDDPRAFSRYRKLRNQMVGN